jgi:predicted alpha/beta hydrolase
VIAHEPVVARDGARSRALACAAQIESRGAILCVPAMGTPAGYYEPFAKAMSAVGYDVMVCENRGTGTSEVKPRRGVDFGYHHMIVVDFPAALDAIRRRFPGKPVHVVGHSLGGQLAALFGATHPGAFDRLVLVASGSVDYRGFPQPWRTLMMTQLASTIARTLGYFPGHRLGFGGLQPTTVIRDWARQSRTGRYTLGGASIDYERALADAELSMHAISIDGDQLCPVSATERLVAKLGKATATRAKVTLASGRGDPHFRWARSGTEVAAEIARYLEAV